MASGDYLRQDAGAGSFGILFNQLQDQRPGRYRANLPGLTPARKKNQAQSQIKKK